MDFLEERGAPSGPFLVSIVLDVRHQLTAVDNKHERAYTAAVGTSNYNRVHVNVRPPLKLVSLCVGWATAGFTIRNLSSVLGVMGHVRRRCLVSVELPVVVLGNIMVLR